MQQRQATIKEVKVEIDIDLNDPEVTTAAIKIQAGFKGYKVRKELRSKKVVVRLGVPYHG